MVSERVEARADHHIRRVLLVIVGARGFSSKKISDLSRRDQATGRLLVDVAVDPPVDLQAAHEQASLLEAMVTLTAVPSKPGCYRADLWVRPHYQLAVAPLLHLNLGLIPL